MPAGCKSPTGILSIPGTGNLRRRQPVFADLSVVISTGAMMLKKRSQQRGQTAQRIGNWVARSTSPGVATATRFNLARCWLTRLRGLWLTLQRRCDQGRA